MATFAFIDAYVEVNSVDHSDHVRSVTLQTTAEELDDSAMGDTYRSKIGGLLDGSISIEFNQDFAAGEADASFFSILGTVVTFEIRPDSDAASATNPKYTGSVLINDYSPVANGVGDLATLSVTWPTTGTITRATS